MGDLIGKVAMALIVLTFAGMVLRNTSGTAQVLNTTLGGYGNLLSTARGSS